MRRLSLRGLADHGARRVALNAAVGLALTCVSAGLPMWAADSSLPDGPGKVELERVCSACHAPEIVVGKHETKERWDEIVSTMVDRGASGTDAELNAIVTYLAAHFGPAEAPAAKPAEPPKDK